MMSIIQKCNFIFLSFSSGSMEEHLPLPIQFPNSRVPALGPSRNTQLNESIKILINKSSHSIPGFCKLKSKSSRTGFLPKFYDF